MPTPRQSAGPHDASGRSAFELKGRRVWVAGHGGMVGSAMARSLVEEGCEVLTVERERLDLRRQGDVEAWVSDTRPEVVVMAAGRVGGISANDGYPKDFIYDNLAMQTNIFEASYRADVQKLLFLGSSCIYPKHVDQPIAEESLLSGSLEPTNQWYAVAKIAGIKLAQSYRRQFGCDYICAMPTNLYGPGDNFDLNSGHVLPAMMRRMHDAVAAREPEVVIWGTGTPRRELMHVDDCVSALIFMLKSCSQEEHVNVGTGEEISIQALAELVAEVVGFRGRIANDLTRADGAARKLMSGERLAALGWRPRIPLRRGVEQTYAWFRDSGSVRLTDRLDAQAVSNA